ncbi:MAG TPA: DUF4153 domain-containing protein [bacterium]|nr:DUF4153 domain-containing protein [bacterium]
MKLPSLRQIVEELKRILVRFPLVMTAAITGTIAALVLIEQEGPAKPTLFLPLLLTSMVGFFLLLGLSMLAEKRNWSSPLRFAAQGGALLLLLVYGFSLPTLIDNEPAVHIVRFLMLMVAALLFALVVPFAGTREENGFWHYAKAIVIRFLTAAFYAGVLQIGLSLALLALNQLFDISIPDERYGELWVLLVGLFGTSFFLAGMPEDLNALETKSDYPKGLKIFAQNILSAVMLVYLVILYAYLAKIILAWSWPRGWVSGLILGFSATGIVALLLLWPIRSREENRWGHLVWRWFFVVLIPLVVMLFLAVWRRISEYGLTFSRSLGLAAALFLALLILYFLLGKSRNIKVIPGLLGIMALLLSFGPWSLFSVSEKSQKERLETLLTRNGLLAGGTIQKAAREVPDQDALQISSIISYLHEMHGYGAIQSWFREPLVAEKEGKQLRLKPDELAGMLGVEYLRGPRGGSGPERSLNAKREGSIDIAGYDRMVTGLFAGEDGELSGLEGTELTCTASNGLERLTLVLKEGKGVGEALSFELLPVLERLYAEWGQTNPDLIPPGEMALSAESEHLRAKLYLRHVHVEKKDEVLKNKNLSLDLLYALKP